VFLQENASRAGRIFSSIGMDANDPVLGYSPAVAFGIFSWADYFGVRFSTQTFGSEYGQFRWRPRAITQSGSNHFHGRFLIARDAALEARTIRPSSPSQSRHSCAKILVHICGLWRVITRSFLQSMKASGKCGHPGHCDQFPYALAPSGIAAGANDPNRLHECRRQVVRLVSTYPRVQPFLALLPPSNGADNVYGTET